MNQNAKASSIISKQQSSAIWLQEHGLHSNGLTIDQILPKLGFKQSEGTIPNGKKVASTYNKGLFIQHPNSKGKVYNITASYSQINSYEKKLENATELFTARIKWLNSGSCLQFGAVTDKRVCLIVHGDDDGSKYFDQFISGVSSLLKNQISHLSGFNLLRCTDEVERFSEDMVDVSPSAIEEADDWLKQECYKSNPALLTDPAPSQDTPQSSIGSSSSIVKAVVQASTMENVDSIFVITFGPSAMQSYSELKETVSTLLVPLNVSAYCVKDKQFLEEFQEIAGLANGRFHLYNPPGIYSKSPSSRPSSSRPSSSRQSSRPSSAWSSSSSKSSNSKSDVASVPDTEVLMVWKELEESRNTLADLQAIQLEKKVANPLEEYSPPSHCKDDYISSAEWLMINGLNNNRLLYRDLVNGLAFQHCEGVIRVHKSPTHSSPLHKNGDVELLVNHEEKLVEAQYCKGFVHLRWIDGRIIHTHLEKRPYESYKRNVEKVILKCNQRRDWLCKGSRELFGTVLEQNVIILLDTSSSMAEHLPLVKRKLRQLALEQLIHKSRFTMIHFGTEVSTWKDSLVPVTPDTITSMIEWVMILEAQGSTNTLEALKKAVGITGVEAIYLLTDGRPDQPFETVVQHLRQWRKVTVHTISFNCADTKANHFLSKLATMTGGRYHYYSENLSDPDGPVTHRSEDLQRLDDEVELAQEQLTKAEQLYEECSKLKHVGKTGSKSRLLGRSSSQSLSKRRVSSLTKWIEANNLLSRDLTIIDALGPASVPHDPAHIDIIDKDVRGKVFENIMTKAHVSGDGHVKLINPNGVDIRNYVMKLDQYIKECKGVVMEFGVCKLPIDAERTLRADVGLSSRATLTFDRHFNALCEKLKELECSEILEEIDRIQDEIVMAEQYKNQAESLLEEVKRKNQQSKLLDSTDGLQSPSYASSTSCSSAVSLKSDIIGRSGSVDKTVTSEQKKRNAKINRTGAIQRGQRVACLHPEYGVYYPGIFVKQLDSDGFCEVKLAQQERVKVLTKVLVPYGGSTPCPILAHGDYVLVRTRVHHGEHRDMFLPGVVASTPGNPRVSSARYDVTLLGGKIVFCSRSALIKIETSRYRKIYNILSTKLHSGQDESEAAAKSITSSVNSVSRKNTIPKQSHIPTPQAKVSKRLPVKRGSMDSGDEESDDEVEEGHLPPLKSPTDTSLLNNDGNDVTDSSKRTVHGTPTSNVPVNRETSPGPLTLDVGTCTEPAIDKETSPCPLRLDVGTCTGPAIDKGISPTPLMLDVGTCTGPTIDKETSPSPLMLDVGTCTGPITMETGVATYPETQEIATKTSSSPKEKEVSEQRKKDAKEPLKEKPPGEDTPKNDSFEEADLSVASKSGQLTVDMLATSSPHKSPPSSEQRAGVKGQSSLSPQIGEQVLARWSDDGLYHRGMVVGYDGGDDPEVGKWTLTDANNLSEFVKRDNFITDYDDGDRVIKVGDSVIGLHPTYPNSYAPGKVKSIMVDGFHLTIQLYDDCEVTLPRHEVYSISEEKYQDSLQFIMERKRDWVGKAVIARSNKTGLFYPGKVLEHLKNSQRFKIKWANGSTTIKNARDIFGELTRRRPLHMGDYVIALPIKGTSPVKDSGESQGTCYPGQIVGVQDDDKVLIQMHNSASYLTTFKQCFWISQTYYIDTINRMKH